MPCPKCGFKNPGDFQFCGSCGQRLEHVGLKDPTPIMDGERKHVTILFSDLSGYTAMTERLDPEDVKSIMNEVFDCIRRVIAKYEGYIAKFIGDAVMAVFGIPKAHEDDAFRAIRAAMEIHRQVETLSIRHMEKLGAPLSMHSGINTGLVVTGEAGSEKGAQGVTGFAVNIASRLEGLSKSGEILVGHRTYLQSNRYFEFAELDPIRVEGKSEPARVYRVLSERSPGTSISGQLESGRMFGRKNELSRLVNAVSRLTAEHKGGVLFITGDAGIGKSRLISEVKKTLSPHQLLWLEGRSLSYGQNFSYLPFLDMLRSLFGIKNEDEALLGFEKLKTGIQKLFGQEFVDILPYFATHLAFEVNGEMAERVEYLDGEGMRRQIFKAYWLLIMRLSQQRPLVMEFEDFQWSDWSTIRLIEHLLPLVRKFPLIMCFISRPSASSAVSELREVVKRDFFGYEEEITLCPLSSGECLQMVAGILLIDDISPQMQGLVLRKSEGNPLYLEELLRILVHRGAITKSKIEGKWAVGPIKGKVPIPETLVSLITAEIDRLDEEIKEVVKIASVIGRCFLYRLLKSLRNARADLDHHLSVLQQEGFIKEKARLPELEYLFKHDLIKEAAYESILIQERRTLHLGVGRAIEDVFAGRLERFYALLAYHYAQASELAKAQEYLLKAGDQAIKIAADDEALAQFKKAISACEQMIGEDWDKLQRATLQRKMAESLFRRGQNAKAADSLKQALELLDDPFPVSKWGTRAGIAKEAAIQLVHRCLPESLYQFKPEKDKRRMEERIRTREVLGWIDYYGNRERFLFNAVSGANFLERCNHSSGMPRGFLSLGMICDAYGSLCLARKYHSLAKRYAEKAKHPVSLGLCSLAHGLHLFAQGDWNDAMAEFNRSEELSEKIGDLKLWATSSILIAVLHHLRGDFKVSLHLCEKISSAGRAAGDKQILAWGLHGQAFNLMTNGDLTLSERLLSEATEILGAVPDYYVLQYALGDLAMCYTLQGKLDQASKALDEADSVIEKYGLRGLILSFVRNTKAETALIMAEGIGENERRTALKKIGGLLKTALRVNKRFKVDEGRSNRLMGTFCWLKGRESPAKNWWKKAMRIAEEQGAKCEAGRIYYEMGKRTKNPDLLNKAKAIFEMLDARLDLERAERENPIS